MTDTPQKADWRIRATETLEEVADIKVNREKHAVEIHFPDPVKTLRMDPASTLALLRAVSCALEALAPGTIDRVIDEEERPRRQ